MISTDLDGFRHLPPGVADASAASLLATPRPEPGAGPRAERHAPRVGLVGSSDLVHLGLTAMLSAQAPVTRPRLVARDHLRPHEVDLVLVDTQNLAVAADRVRGLVRAGFDSVATLGEEHPIEVRRHLEAVGACDHVSLDLTSDELVRAVRTIATRREVLEPSWDHTSSPFPALEAARCSQRESEVLTLICRGLSNQEISEELDVGINTVKSYVRTAYRKIGVTSRTRAVLWGLDHGL